MIDTNPLQAIRHTRPSRLRGVTLVELMVGMLIGLIAVLVISQVLIAAEGHKRTTTSGSDAQLTGTLALYTLHRDLQMAGYGLSNSELGLGCEIRSVRFTATNGGTTRPLVPALITPGAKSGDPDTLRIFASSKDSFSVPTLITSDHPKTGVAGVTEFAVNNTVGIRTGDLMIAVPSEPDAGNTCTMFRATGVGSTVDKSFTHWSGAEDPFGWNGTGSGAAQTVVRQFPSDGYPAGSYVVNLGAGLIDRSYSVVDGALQLSEFDNQDAKLVTTELFPQVVNFRALYGKDADGNGVIDIYDNVQPTTPEQWSRVVAIRLALVVRSSQFESDEVTPAAPEWELGATPSVGSTLGAKACKSGGANCITLDVDGDITSRKDDWKHYRYKIYDTVVPLRNVLWRS